MKTANAEGMMLAELQPNYTFRLTNVILMDHTALMKIFPHNRPVKDGGIKVNNRYSVLLLNIEATKHEK